MKLKPHDYQEFAINVILDNEKSALFLDMGLGKTIAALTAINELMYNRLEVQKVLVIAPLMVCKDTWPKEIAKWDHTKHLSHSGIYGSGPKQRTKALNVEADIYITNVDNIEWLIEQFGHYSNKKRKWGFKFDKKWPFDMVIIDESSLFKSQSTKRFKIIKKVLPFIERLVLLSGTPAPNGLLDLWPQLFLLDQGERLGRTFGGYRARYFTATKEIFARGRKIPTGYVPYEEDIIYEKIQDICVSMKSTDHLDMPDLVKVFTEVELSKKEMQKYRELEKELIISIDNDDIDNDIVASNKGVLANKLLQMANGSVYTEKRDVIPIHDHKLDALKGIVESANGRPLLVFYSYIPDKEKILKAFPDAELLNDPSVIDRWDKGEIPMLVAHPKSAGHGLNLQKGSNYVVWYGLNWSLELYLQANARVYRQGQDESRVILNHIVAKGTYDMNVVKSLKKKKITQDSLIEATKAYIKERE